MENLGLCVGNREARADRQGGELIDRVAAGAPIPELLSIKALGDVRMRYDVRIAGAAIVLADIPDHALSRLTVLRFARSARVDAHGASRVQAGVTKGLPSRSPPIQEPKLTTRGKSLVRSFAP